jgi:hypothetical protein
MGLGVIRLQFNRGAAFFRGGLEVSQAVERLREFKPMAWIISGEPDGAARFAEGDRGVRLLQRGRGRQGMCFAQRLGRRRRTFNRRLPGRLLGALSK